MKRAAKELIASIERLGFEYDRTNSKNFDIYVCGDAEVSISPGIQEHAARNILKSLERSMGVNRETNKRNPGAIRERQAKQRDALRSDIERQRIELDSIIARRARQLDGAAAALTDAEIVRIQRHIEGRERELREIEALMRGATLSTNRAKHRA